MLSRAACFEQLPPGMAQVAKVALLYQIWQARNPGQTLSVQTLVTRGMCFAVLPYGMQQIARLQLYCNILGGIA